MPRTSARERGLDAELMRDEEAERLRTAPRVVCQCCGQLTAIEEFGPAYRCGECRSAITAAGKRFRG